MKSFAWLLILFSFVRCTSIAKSKLATLPVEEIPAATSQLEWISQQTFRPDELFQKTQIGGLSGLVYEAKRQALFAVSDDSGADTELGPARIYQFKFEIKNNQGHATPQRVIPVRGIRKGAADLEAITPYQGGWLIAQESETDMRNKQKAGDTTAASHPRLVQLKRNGEFVREYLLPARFQPEGSPAHGSPVNASIEGLTSMPDHFAGADLAMITEAPLRQDQAQFPLDSRFTLFSLKKGKWKEHLEYVYPLSPPTQNVGFNPTLVDRGISDLLYLGQGKFWVLERSFYMNKELKKDRDVIEIFEIDLALSPASPTQAVDQLGPHTVLSKKRVANLDDFIAKMPPVPPTAGNALDNVEGMTFGPTLDGHQTLILVTDDNFGEHQRTLLSLYKIIPRPTNH